MSRKFKTRNNLYVANWFQGMLTARVGYSVEGLTMPSIEKVLGAIPVMVRSKSCHLHNLAPKHLVDSGEHEQVGGFAMFFLLRRDTTNEQLSGSYHFQRSCCS